MSNLVQNLQVRMRVTGLNQKNLAVRAGLNETAVRDILKGRSKDPQYGTVAAIARVLGCHVDELFLEVPSNLVLLAETAPQIPGRGRPRKNVVYGLSDHRLPPWPAGAATQAREVERSASFLVYIEEIDISDIRNGKALTDGRGKSVVATWHIPSALLLGGKPASDSDYIIVQVNEDSMTPDFNQGDRVLVDLKATSPSPAGVFLLWDGAGFIVRRCEVVPNSRPMRVALKARNSEYGSYEAALKDISICGRVIGRWQKT